MVMITVYTKACSGYKGVMGKVKCGTADRQENQRQFGLSPFDSFIRLTRD
jgi:hypothetical protein